MSPTSPAKRVTPGAAEGETPAKLPKASAPAQVASPTKQQAAIGATQSPTNSQAATVASQGSTDSQAAIGVAQALVKPKRSAPPSLWAAYYSELAIYVETGLAKGLKKCGVDIECYGGLHNVPPTDIEKNNAPAIGGGQFTTYKETWHIERCVVALQTAGKYSAAGSLWWFMLNGGAITFQGQQIFTAEPDRAAVEAAGGGAARSGPAAAAVGPG